jgi:hypothetical protein
MVARSSLGGAAAIGVRVGRVLNNYKVGTWVAAKNCVRPKLGVTKTDTLARRNSDARVMKPP